MSSDPIVPYGLQQNPAPSQPLGGQEYLTRKSELVNDLMETFRQVLPSNYVAQVNGPWNSLQFQAMLEQLADAQLSANEVYKDSYWDLTRPEYLWQVLGTLVFPSGDAPQIDGDVSYRDFLRGMVELLLQGSTLQSIKGGIELLQPGIVVQVIEKYLSTPPRDPVGGNTLLDQFGIEIFVDGGNSFPGDPFLFQENLKKVLLALKPAHVLYTYSYLFTDKIEEPSDEGGLFLELSQYYYDDVRKYQWGARGIDGTGEILPDRYRLRDESVSFSSISRGASLRVGGTLYRVTSVEGFNVADATPRVYTTSPTGLTGLLRVLSSLEGEDLTQDWGLAQENEILTLSSGPNAGQYRLNEVLGANGGLILNPGEYSGTRVRISPGTLRVTPRFPSSGTTSYSLEVDRLGTQEPNEVLGEDVSVQFYL